MEMETRTLLIVDKLPEAGSYPLGVLCYTRDVQMVYVF